MEDLQWMQQAIDAMDASIRSRQGEEITLKSLARLSGYSSFHFSRKFFHVTGMHFRDYLRLRRLVFALREIRDTEKRLVDIALEYGFSSHQALTHAFRRAYGIAPAAYRKNPRPLALCTLLRPFDCYLLEKERNVMEDTQESVRTYFIAIPAHQFLHIRNYESIGYWDFWQKQAAIPGQDCETICGLLDSIPGKLDDLGGDAADSGSGQVMAFLNAPEGRICSWGIPLAECYGVRLPLDYQGPIPEQMMLTEIPAGEYIVFEHGPFDFEKENAAVEAKIEAAMKSFDWAASGYQLDTAPGRIFYFYHDCRRYWKYVRPVVRTE